jgi:hypothetical protein
MTDLSTEEVIMNNVVKSPEESDFPKMHLVVLEGSNHVESPYHYTTDEISIAFVNPYSTEEFPEELQFVVEVDGPASFIHGGTIGCDGNKRVASRLIDDDGKVVLKINDPTATLRVWSGWATGQNPVRLTPDLILEPSTAGAAAAAATPDEKDTKQEEDKETPEQPEQKLIEPEKDRELDEDVEAVKAQAAAKKSSNKKKSNLLETDEVHPELKEIPNHRKDHHNTKQKIVHHQNRERGQRSGDGGVGAAARNIADKLKENQLDLTAERKGRQNNMDPNKMESTDDDYDKAEGENEEGQVQKRKQHTAKELADKLKAAKMLDEKRRESDESIKNHRKKLEAEMKKNFESATSAGDLDTFSHLLGCGFFIVCIGGILILFGKKRDKGRRDL